jgi:hypothetical protein
MNIMRMLNKWIGLYRDRSRQYAFAVFVISETKYIISGGSLLIRIKFYHVNY